MKLIRNIILLTAIVLTGCSGDGIFQNLENEEEILDTNNLSSGTTLNQFLLFGDQYVINGKNVWHSTRESGSDTWDKYPQPDKYDSDRTFPSIAVFNGQLYATVISHDASYRSGIIRYNSTSEEWEEIYHTNKLDASSGTDFYRFRLFPAGDKGIYLNAIQYNTDDSENSTIEDSSLYFFPDSPAGAAALAAFDIVNSPTVNRVTFPDSSDFDMPVVAIALDTSANDVYMIYNTSGSTPDNGILAVADGDSSYFSFSAETTVSDNYDFLSLYYSPSYNMLFIGTEADDDDHPILYKSGGTWSSIFCEDNDVEFSAFVEIPDLYDRPSVLAGTRAFEDPTSSSSIQGNGYYQIYTDDMTIHDNKFSDDNNYESSDLADATIQNFYYDALYSKVYATTYNQGLWLNQDENWSQE